MKLIEELNKPLAGFGIRLVELDSAGAGTR